MKRYDPDRAPDREKWLALDEQARIGLVATYHRRIRAKLPNPTLHAVIHAVVENQLAEQIPAVERTVERLIAEGLGRHDAIHAIGSVVAEHMWNLMKEKPRGVDLQDPHGPYFRRLETLTAKAWLEGAS